MKEDWDSMCRVLAELTPGSRYSPLLGHDVGCAESSSVCSCLSTADQVIGLFASAPITTYDKSATDSNQVT